MIIDNKKGFSLVELVVAIGIFFILASGVFFVITNSYSNFTGSGDRQTVANFAKEGLEAVQAIANNNWSDITTAVGSNKGVALNSSTKKWEFSGTSNTSGSLTRIINIMNVERDGFIIKEVGAGGVDDPLIKRVTVTVSGVGISDYVLAAYITNWKFSTWEQTDWSGGSGYPFWGNPTIYDTDTSMDVTTVTGEINLFSDKGVFDAGGSLDSGVISMFATDKKLYKIEVYQNVPSGCTSEVVFSVSDYSDFSGSPPSQSFQNDSLSYYTESFNANMSGYEWLKYQVNFTSCNGDTEGPTIYSIKIFYQ